MATRRCRDPALPTAIRLRMIPGIPSRFLDEADGREARGRGAADLGVKLRAADRVWPGLPRPVEPEALAVPRQNRGGLHDDETGPSTHPDP